MQCRFISPIVPYANSRKISSSFQLQSQTVWMYYNINLQTDTILEGITKYKYCSSNQSYYLCYCGDENLMNHVPKSTFPTSGPLSAVLRDGQQRTSNLMGEVSSRIWSQQTRPRRLVQGQLKGRKPDMVCLVTPRMVTIYFYWNPVTDSEPTREAIDLGHTPFGHDIFGFTSLILFEKLPPVWLPVRGRGGWLEPV